MKPGVQTSEFVLTLIAYAVSITGFILGSVLEDGHWAIQAAALATSGLASLGYSISRGQAKAALPFSGPTGPAVLPSTDSTPD